MKAKVKVIQTIEVITEFDSELYHDDVNSVEAMIAVERQNAEDEEEYMELVMMGLNSITTKTIRFEKL